MHSGACGLSEDSLELEPAHAHRSWADATFDVIESARVFREVLGDRRERERLAEAAEQSRFVR